MLQFKKLQIIFVNLVLLISCVIAMSCTKNYVTPQPPREVFNMAINQAMHGNLNETLYLLQSIPLDELSSDEKESAETILGRFSTPTFQFEEAKFNEYPELIINIFASYHEYLYNVLLNKVDRVEAGVQFIEFLIELTQMPIQNDVDLTDWDVRIDVLTFVGSQIEELGIYAFLDYRAGIYDFCILKTKYEEEYIVELPVGKEKVTVVFLDDFIELGWFAYATADRYHIGGWVAPDKIYCVKSAYDLESEDFANYLVHEAQHYQDDRVFPHMENAASVEMGYRAKLAEVIMGNEIVVGLLNAMETFQSDDPDMAHFYANRLVIGNLRTRLPLLDADWESVELPIIQDIARELLAEDTARLMKTLEE